MAGKKFACSTACFAPHETGFCATAIAQKAYSLARGGSLKLPGFPSFDSVVNDLKESKEIQPPSYEVCVPLGNGGLAIKANLIEHWEKNDVFQVEAQALIEKHNKKYNPQGIKRGLEENAQAGSSSEPAAKRVRLETVVKMADLESKIANKKLYNV